MAIAAMGLSWAEGAKPSVTKDETVFAVLDPYGKVESVTVSDWLHSDKAGIELHDRSSLTSIENVKGKESPRRSGDDLVWTLTGKDVYYRGDSTRPLPLSFHVSYFLDGKAIEPKALVGKAGNVRIRVDVKNTSSASVLLEGKKVTLYTPIIVVIGADLPTSTFHDIQVTNGKLISDGQNNIVAGVLLPGLMQSIEAASASAIDLSSLGVKGLAIPDSFEFTAKTDSFKMGSIMIGASTELPDLGGSNSAKELSDALAAVKQLGAASTQIKEGTAALAGGAAQLHDGISTATGALSPLLAKKDELATLTAFIGKDENVAAARNLLAEGKKLEAAAPALRELASTTIDAKTKALIDKTLADAKGLDVTTLLNSPLMSGLVSDATIKGMAEAMTASDDLYSSIDEGRLTRAAAFAANSGPLLSSLSAYDATVGAYKSASGAAIAALAKDGARYDRAAAGLASLGAFDAASTASALASQTAANAAFMDKTAFLSDGASGANAQGLATKLASGAALSADERAALATLIAAIGKERAAIASSAAAQADAARALPILADAAASAAAARPAAQAAADLSAAVIPGLEAAAKDRGANGAALASAQASLDPKTVQAIAKAVPRIIDAKKSYQKNHFSFELARTALGLMANQGGFRAQLTKLGALQKDLTELQPTLDKGLNFLSSQAATDLIGDPDKLSANATALLADFDRVSVLLPIAEEITSPDAVTKARELTARLPELESGLGTLNDGSKLLADKLKELAAGTAQFDKDGIQRLVGLADNFGGMAKGFLETKDNLVSLSRDYRTYSGASPDALASVKFVIKTDELY
jgi:putative membrane protein